MSSGRPEGPDPDGIGKKWREQARESVCDDILAVRDFREIGAHKLPLTLVHRHFLRIPTY